MKTMIAITGIAVALLTACNSPKMINQNSKVQSGLQQQSGDTMATMTKPPAELVGKWSFTKLPAEAGGTIFTNEYLVFDPAEMRVNGKASCNGFFGNYTIGTNGNKQEIHFKAIGHTMMACENLATENKMLKAIEKVTT